MMVMLGLPTENYSLPDSAIPPSHKKMLAKAFSELESLAKSGDLSLAEYETFATRLRDYISMLPKERRNAANAKLDALQKRLRSIVK